MKSTNYNYLNLLKVFAINLTFLNVCNSGKANRWHAIYILDFSSKFTVVYICLKLKVALIKYYFLIRGIWIQGPWYICFSVDLLWLTSLWDLIEAQQPLLVDMLQKDFFPKNPVSYNLEECDWQTHWTVCIVQFKVVFLNYAQFKQVPQSLA